VSWVTLTALAGRSRLAGVSARFEFQFQLRQSTPNTRLFSAPTMLKGTLARGVIDHRSSLSSRELGKPLWSKYAFCSLPR
jgi:hypothetical protein